MFEVWKDGAYFALVKVLVYIKQHEEGYFVLCGEAEAQGIVVDGTPYTLSGREPMTGTETVELREAEFVTASQIDIIINQGIVGQLAAAITEGVQSIDE